MLPSYSACVFYIKITGIWYLNIILTVVFSVTLFELTVVNNWYIIMVSEPVLVYILKCVIISLLGVFICVMLTAHLNIC